MILGAIIRTDSTGTHFSSLGSQANVSLRFGWRRYHPAGPKVAAYHSFGLVGGLTHGVTVDPVSGSAVANGWNAGVFGDIGGSYFLTPRLSVGATITAEVRYFDLYSHYSGGRRSRSWELDGSAPGVGFVAALYF